jgi:hypothetical protein
MYNNQIGLNKINDSFRTLRTLNIKNLVKLDLSIYVDVNWHIHVLKCGYAQSAIFTTIFLFKYLYLYNLCTDWHKLRYNRYIYFLVLIFHICTYEMKHMMCFSSHCYKTALFSISKRLWKGIARMDSNTFVVTNNPRMLQNDAALFLLVRYT